MKRVLHLLAQRPSLTGSGITLDAMVRGAARTSWDQHVVVGVPAQDPRPTVGDLPADRIHPLVFEQGSLDFPVPGMSDVMPYPSTRYSALSPEQIETYCQAWRAHLKSVAAVFNPDVVHTHHVWLLSAMAKDIFPDTRVVTQCHATGFRQMIICPHLADRVRTGCVRNDHFLALHTGHAETLVEILGISEDRVSVVGAGFREDLFHTRGADPDRGHRVIYIGKYSAAKGLPWLLDAVEALAGEGQEIELHVAGSGAGSEADALKSRMEAMAPRVVLHGQVDQARLGDLMRRCAVCVLPSFYEGVPLVLAEALCCGCRLVTTNLPGVMNELVPSLGFAMERIDLPRLINADQPVKEDLPAFVKALTQALGRALGKPPLGDCSAALQPFSWDAVFERVAVLWK